MASPRTKTTGENNASAPGVEAQLDIQFLMGVANSVETYSWYTEGERTGGNEPFMIWLLNVTASTAPLPNVFSISYQDYEDTVSELQVNKAN